MRVQEKIRPHLFPTGSIDALLSILGDVLGLPLLWAENKTPAVVNEGGVDLIHSFHGIER